MARQVTSGFELQSLIAQDDGAPVVFSGTVSIDTGTVRSGAASAKCVTTGGVQNATVKFTVTTALGTWTYCRAYIRFQSTVNNQALLQLLNTHGFIRARTTSAQLVLTADIGGVGSPIGSASVTTLLPDTWYRIELGALVSASGNDNVALYLDGVLVAASSAISTFANSLITECDAGIINLGSGSGATVFVDDVAINDSTGTAQNTYPGAGKVVLLKPTADAARTIFTTGSGTTTGLSAAVDNTPPVGVAAGSATATSQIIGSGATSLYEPSLGAYTTAVTSGGGGMAVTDIPNVLQAIAAQAASATSAAAVGLSGVSNPVIAEASASAPTTAGGTYPTNWITMRTPVVYAPVVTLGTSPVLKLRPMTGTAATTMCALMGLMVEYAPPALASTARAGMLM